MTTPLAPNSVSRIIQLAYEDAAIVQEGSSPNGDQWLKGITRLTDIVNYWQTQGLKLFLNAIQTVTLVAGQKTYTLGPTGTIVIPKPTRVLEAYYIDTSATRRPLNVMGWKDYDMLSQQNQQGAINSYFVDKQVSLLAVSFWQVPDVTAATGTVALLVQNQVTTPIALTDTMQFPVEWYLALRWALADELATGQPAAIVQNAAARAAAYRAALEAWDVEDAPTRFTVDQQMTFGSRRFR